MKLFFNGNTKGLTAGIEIIQKELNFTVSEDGTPITIEKTLGNIEVELKGGKGIIRYNEKIHFFRALGLFIEQLRERTEFKIVEKPLFTLNGGMFDVSRNAVLTVNSIKNLLRKMSIMGLNMVMLYAEDTYTIEGNPYFGYMRGKYTYNELKECDDYADKLGIEIIPCIQTLAHLKQALKWSYAENIKDTDDILLVGNKKTYEFIEQMITSAAAPFRSKRIHIGMDEAHDLGLGKYLTENGFRRRFDIMNEHLGKVLEITSAHKLKPMFWSDMYFRLASKTGRYYDLESKIPEDVIKNVPENVQLVYWDYYNVDKKTYIDMINAHNRFENDVVFAGGTWTWAGNCINYNKTIAATNPALEACKEKGIKEVFTTFWGDNGAETNVFFGLLGLQLFAEHGYSEVLDLDKLKRRV
ncbi:MAG: beta-N-acetylhexosaminidase [Clostridiales bacterium]|nr:beta-N-acetylhexosaminidase [Clostridiales bacterium]